MLVFHLVAWALFRPATLADASSTEIPMTLYTDNSCKDASTTAANVSLNLDVCTVTPGLGSFVLNPFPCSSGSVIGYVFSDTACGNANQNNLFKGGGDGANPHCYGPIKGDLAAVMLSCDQNTPKQPSSTTTIKVGPIATGASITSPSSSSTTKGASSDGSSSSSSSSNDSGTPGSSSSGWKSLNSGTRVGIIVALSVGIPLLTISGIYKERKRRAQGSHGIAMRPNLVHTSYSVSSTHYERFAR